MHHLPGLAALVVFVMERQSGAVGVPHHVVAVIGEAVGVAQFVADGGEMALFVVLVGHEGVAEVGIGHAQGQRADVLPGVFDEQVASARFTDRSQPAVLPLVIQPVAAQVADAVSGTSRKPSSLRTSSALGKW